VALSSPVDLGTAIGDRRTHSGLSRRDDADQDSGTFDGVDRGTCSGGTACSRTNRDPGDEDGADVAASRQGSAGAAAVAAHLHLSACGTRRGLSALQSRPERGARLLSGVCAGVPAERHRDHAPYELLLAPRLNASGCVVSIPILEFPGFEFPWRQRLQPPLHPAIWRPMAETGGFLDLEFDHARGIAAAVLMRRLTDHVDEFGLVGHGALPAKRLAQAAVCAQSVNGWFPERFELNAKPQASRKAREFGPTHQRNLRRTALFALALSASLECLCDDGGECRGAFDRKLALG